MKKLTIMETFAGAGGNHIGWKEAGFKSLYINDFDQNMINTITYNNPELKNIFVDSTSILDIKPKEIMKKIGIKSKELDVLFGGIVCKGFSLAGERNPMDERNYFYHKQLDLVKSLKPKISVIENVSGIMSAYVISHDAPIEIKDEINKIWNRLSTNKFKRSKSNKKLTEIEKVKLESEFDEIKQYRTKYMKEIEKKGYFVSVIDDIKSIYSKLGYRVYLKTLRSSDYSVATTRQRVFVVAVRKDLKGDYVFPKPTSIHGEMTVRKAISKSKISENDVDSLPMKHTENVVERFSYIPQGKNIADVMDKIPPRLRINRFFSRGSNMRLSWDKPAPTLVPGHSAFPLHPKENRSITVREAALITGFPKEYKFFGSHSKRCEQVGNAIPPKLANAVAVSVRKFLEKQ